MHQNELHIAVSAGQSLSEWLHAIIFLRGLNIVLKLRTVCNKSKVSYSNEYVGAKWELYNSLIPMWDRGSVATLCLCLLDMVKWNVQ